MQPLKLATLFALGWFGIALALVVAIATGPRCEALGFCPSIGCYSSINCGPSCSCLQTQPPHPGVCVSLR